MLQALDLPQVSYSLDWTVMGKYLATESATIRRLAWSAR